MDKKFREIFDCNLGWDLTDFGTGNFAETGLFLFTVRNGVNESKVYPKPYAEKIMISRSNQVTLTHCHELKREDIINRGGGTGCSSLSRDMRQSMRRRRRNYYRH